MNRGVLEYITLLFLILALQRSSGRGKSEVNMAHRVQRNLLHLPHSTVER